MVDVTELCETVKTAQATLTGITVYDGYVPTTLPEADGFILPYIVNWFGVGDNPEGPAANGQQPVDSLVWDFQTTVVASNPAACRAVAQALKQKLTNLRVGTGRVRTNPDGFTQQTPTLDPQVTPARFMLPLQWRLNTN